MQRLEVSGAVRPIYVSLSVKRLITKCRPASQGEWSPLWALKKITYLLFQGNIKETDRRTFLKLPNNPSASLSTPNSFHSPWNI